MLPWVDDHIVLSTAPRRLECHGGLRVEFEVRGLLVVRVAYDHRWRFRSAGKATSPTVKKHLEETRIPALIAEDSAERRSNHGWLHADTLLATPPELVVGLTVTAEPR